MKTLGMGIEERQIRWLKFHRSEENFGFSGNAWCRRRSRRSDKEITSDRTPFTAIPPLLRGFSSAALFRVFLPLLPSRITDRTSHRVPETEGIVSH